MFLTKLDRGSKIPPAGESWKANITDDPALHEEWQRQGYNLGMPLEENNRVVLDFDQMEPGREFYRKHPDLCTVINTTRRGVHFHFSGTTKTRKFEHGDIKGNGYVVWKGVVDGIRYQLIKDGILQPFPEHLFPIKNKEIITGNITYVNAYIQQIFAIAGKGGHNSTFRAVCKLRDAGYSEAEALAQMIEWNKTNADPPWDTKALLHKVKSAYSRVLKGG